jgi:hypothetical protein
MEGKHEKTIYGIAFGLFALFYFCLPRQGSDGRA